MSDIIGPVRDTWYEILSNRGATEQEARNVIYTLRSKLKANDREVLWQNKEKAKEKIRSTSIEEMAQVDGEEVTQEFIQTFEREFALQAEEKGWSDTDKKESVDKKKRKVGVESIIEKHRTESESEDGEKLQRNEIEKELKENWGNWSETLEDRDLNKEQVGAFLHGLRAEVLFRGSREDDIERHFEKAIERNISDYNFVRGLEDVKEIKEDMLDEVSANEESVIGSNETETPSTESTETPEEPASSGLLEGEPAPATRGGSNEGLEDVIPSEDLTPADQIEEAKREVERSIDRLSQEEKLSILSEAIEDITDSDVEIHIEEGEE